MRARYFEVAQGPSGRPLAGVTVNVYQAGTTTPVAETIYAASSGGTALTNPLATNSQGEVEFWLAAPARVDLKWTVSGFTAETHTVDVLYSDFVPAIQKGVANGVATLDGTGVVPLAQIPGGAALDAEVAAAVGVEAAARAAADAAHVASGTAHSGTYRAQVAVPGGVDDTAVVQAAIDAATPGRLAAGTYVCTTLTLRSNMDLEGSGVRATIIKLKNGADVDLIKTTNFDTLVGTNANNDGASFFRLANLTIDGNKANNALGRGLCIYGRSFKLDNIDIRNCSGRGIHSEWYTGGDDMEAHVSGLKVHDCESDGIYWNGPHDSTLVNVHSFKNIGKGIWVGTGGAGTQLTNAHVWGVEHTDGFYLEVVAQLVNVQAEGVPAGGHQIVVLGNGTVIQGARVYGTGATGGAAESGIRLGNPATHFLTRCIIDASFTALNGYWINFANDTGRNIIRGAGTLDDGTTFTGTPSSRTQYQFATEDDAAQDIFYAHRIFAGDSNSIRFDSSGSFTLFQATGNGYFEMVEQSVDPAAASANRARLFLRDDGAGNTQLCARFATGATQVMATQQATYNPAVSSGLIDAKGDLIVGSAADTTARLPAGTNGHQLVADSTLTNGVGYIPRSPYRPTAVLAETIPRFARSDSNLATLASGKETLQLIWLDAGTLVSNIIFMSWTTAASAPTNKWFSLRNLSRQLLAVTADDTSTAWAAFAEKSLACAVAYTVPTSGLYYVGIMVAATTPPSLAGASMGGQYNNRVPMLQGFDNTNTGLTTPATAPSTSASLTAASAAGTLLAYVT